MPFEDRLRSLRQELARRQLDGFVVPRADEHLSENVAPCAERLAWLTGFRGSVGVGAVLPVKAAIFVPRLYTLQVRQQVDVKHWSCFDMPAGNVQSWLSENASPGSTVGYDPWLHTIDWVETGCRALAHGGARLIAVEDNPLDVVWRDRPAAPSAKVVVHPIELAGRLSREKRRDIAEWLGACQADAVIISALDSVAWTFNIRGQDIPHTPVALAFALVHRDSSADLFIDLRKTTQEVENHLEGDVRLHERGAFAKHLARLGNATVMVDPERTVEAIFTVLARAGAKVVKSRDPVVLPKAVKNDAEIAGHKRAQIRDGVAMSKFLHWFSIEADKGELTEQSAAAQLLSYRQQYQEFRDLVSKIISAYGPSAALPHYRPTAETNRQIRPGSLYMVDSGGQYIDATTDVTRTVAVGAVSRELRDRFTRVLKGHIAIATAVFPAGTRGRQLDILARQYLWEVGLDYPHTTGHGVGSYLCVHEGPQRIHNPAVSVSFEDDPLAPGMILSNEPGFYQEGEYGMRFENCVLVVVKGRMNASAREMLGFETLTLAPIDRTLIEVDMLTAPERAWIDSYHTKVAQVIAPELEGAATDWLLQVTRPL